MRTQSRQQVPRCWLMTDTRAGDAMSDIAARVLPPRSAIIVRPHALDGHDVARLSTALRRIARARRHVLLWGGAGRPAGFDGIHNRTGRARRGARFVSRPVHDARQAQAARRLGADAVLVSPVFATRSHKGAATLGRRGFARLAAASSAPAIALGGMTARCFAVLRRSGAHGWAAIDAWLEGGQRSA
jgi:thiamine-phosphate pyrophosphorylase